VQRTTLCDSEFPSKRTLIPDHREPGALAIDREAGRPLPCFVAIDQEAGDDVLRRPRRTAVGERHVNEFVAIQHGPIPTPVFPAKGAFSPFGLRKIVVYSGEYRWPDRSARLPPG
jgi:hypothetical protein